MLNVAADKAPMQSSVAEGGIPQKAVDGSTSTFFDRDTCTLTEVEKAPWWWVLQALTQINITQDFFGYFEKNLKAKKTEAEKTQANHSKTQ